MPNTETLIEPSTNQPEPKALRHWSKPELQVLSINETLASFGAGTDGGEFS